MYFRRNDFFLKNYSFPYTYGEGEKKEAYGEKGGLKQKIGEGVFFTLHGEKGGKKKHHGRQFKRIL